MRRSLDGPWGRRRQHPHPLQSSLPTRSNLLQLWQRGVANSCRISGLSSGFPITTNLSSEMVSSDDGVRPSVSGWKVLLLMIELYIFSAFLFHLSEFVTFSDSKVSKERPTIKEWISHALIGVVSEKFWLIKSNREYMNEENGIYFQDNRKKKYFWFKNTWKY